MSRPGRRQVEALAPFTTQDEVRFMGFVAKRGECWIWTGRAAPSGRGSFRVGGGQILAHRFAFLRFNGPLKSGDVVRHTCDVPGCVNPAHLLSGTGSDNMQDALRRDRFSSVMTREAVMQARTRRWLGEPTATIAESLGVSWIVAFKAIHGLTWSKIRDVEPVPRARSDAAVSTLRVRVARAGRGAA